MSFVHLRVQSEYSFLRSVLKMNQIKEQDVIALTDRKMHGIYDFWGAMKGKKAIFGLDVPVINMLSEGVSYVLLLAQNKQGYEELLRLDTKSNLSKQEAITYDDLTSLQHVIVLVGSLTTEIGDRIAHHEDPNELLMWFQNNMRHVPVYFEIQHHELVEPWEDRCTQFGLLQSYFPLVLTNEVVYGEPDEAPFHHIFLSSDRSPSLERSRFDYGENFYLKDDFEMLGVVELIKNKFVKGERAQEAYLNTQKIADQIEIVDLSVSGYFMPETENADEVLRQITFDAVPERYPNANQEVFDRLNFELEVIKNMNFSGYFTILLDIIRYAHDHNIMLGPGRGSASGSAVMYATRVTDVEPIQYDLLFERFLNPERISMPDVDIDVDNDRRGELIQYIVERFGYEHVSQIANFSELSGKSALRMVCEAFGIPPFEKDRISKMVETTLESDLLHNPTLIGECSTNAQTKWLVDLALFFEKKGLKKNTSIHASGIVISSQPLIGFVPMMKGDKLDHAVAIDMKMVEKRGLIKYDILGLKLLSAFRKTLEKINRPDLTKLSNIDLHDDRVYQYIASGQTIGMFQLGLASQITMDMKVSSIEDIIAINGLNRPGPKDQIPTYVRRKFGEEEVFYFHDSLKPVLSYTYGIIIYQEQIMKIAQVVCGYSLGEADLLRRAIGKKIKEILSQEEDKFIRRAVERGYEEGLAKTLFDLIFKFADYGFNRSHATAYALLGYYSAYFKLYYPNIFLAYMMEAHAGESDDSRSAPSVFRSEASRLGIRMIAPDVNTSGTSYEPYRNDIRYGLQSILGVGESASREIVKHAPYVDVRDFMERANVNKGVIKPLLYSGALDALLPTDRLSFVERFDFYMEKLNYDYSFFDVIEHDDVIVREEVGRFGLLRFEHDVLGAYVSEHPIRFYQKEMKENRAQSYNQAIEGGYFKACGILTSAKKKLSKKKTEYVVGSLEDGVSTMNFIGFSKFVSTIGVSLEDYVGSFVIMEGFFKEGQLNANKFQCSRKETDFTTSRFVEDSVALRSFLKQAKKGDTRIIIVKKFGVTEEWSSYVVWDDNLEQFETFVV